MNEISYELRSSWSFGICLLFFLFSLGYFIYAINLHNILDAKGGISILLCLYLMLQSSTIYMVSSTTLIERRIFGLFDSREYKLNQLRSVRWEEKQPKMSFAKLEFADGRRVDLSWTMSNFDPAIRMLRENYSTAFEAK